MTGKDWIFTISGCWLVFGTIIGVGHKVWKRRKHGWQEMLLTILFPYKRQDFFISWRWGVRSADMFFAYILYYGILICAIVVAVKFVPLFFRYLLGVQ